jgi:peptide/nickel transport system substrate-binding protein
MNLRDIQWERQTNSKKFNDQFYKLKYFTPNYNYIGWNSQREFFLDKRVRQAMTMLINREEILQKLLFGNAKIVTGNFYIFSKYYDSNMQPWPYDPKRARELLQEAGWLNSAGDGILRKNGKKFSFTFTISSGSKFAERLATILKEDLAKSGIEMNVERYEWAVFLKRIKDKEFDATALAWSLNYSSDPYQLWHSSQIKGGSNFCSFSNREADRIIEIARQEFDEKKREALYKRFNQILHEEQPYTFLFCNPALSVVSKRFTNVNVHTMGLKLIEWGIAEK